MVHLENLTPAELAIVLDKFLNFEDFANILLVWKRNKTKEEQHLLLQQIDLVKFFANSEWNDQFLPFIYYASNLRILDALSYVPINNCCKKNQPLTDSLQMLHGLDEQGHMLSRFSRNFFTIVYELNGREECIEDMTLMLMTPGIRCYIKLLTGSLKIFYRTVWPRKCINFWFITPLCNKMKPPTTDHFNAFKLPIGWPRPSEDVMAFNCNRCNVSGVIYDFWQYR